MKKRTVWISIGLLGSIASLARAMVTWDTTEWPIERIVSNLEARLRETPEDVGTLYTLGRSHAFAFALERSSLSFIQSDSEEPVDFLRREQTPNEDHSGRTPRPNAEELIAHLSGAVRILSRVVELEPDKANYNLTLAWILETGAHLADRLDAVELFRLSRTDTRKEEIELLLVSLRSSSPEVGQDALEELLDPARIKDAVIRVAPERVSSNASFHERVSKLLQRFWIERSIECYRRAYLLALPEELRDAPNGRWILREPGEIPVITEAGPAFLRLTRARGVRPEEVDLTTSIEATLKEMEGLPMRASFLTPIVLALDGCKSLDELITPELNVPFDLDGDAVDELWPWIAPGTGWLVWDPGHRGEITSGQQLFGTASAWLFFEDGYRVLDALDDDRGGELRGTELAGIAVWFDRDTDGVSDRGEVVPVEELGIVALATQATVMVGRSPANPAGLELADGRILPTYDWVLAPAASPRAGP